MDFLLDTNYLLTLNDINTEDVEYIQNSFLLGHLKNRNEYLYKNYIKINDKKKWFDSEKEHKEWAVTNNKIKYLNNKIKNFKS